MSWRRKGADGLTSLDLIRWRLDAPAWSPDHPEERLRRVAGRPPVRSRRWVACRSRRSRARRRPCRCRRRPSGRGSGTPRPRSRPSALSRAMAARGGRIGPDGQRRVDHAEPGEDAAPGRSVAAAARIRPSIRWARAVAPEQARHDEPAGEDRHRLDPVLRRRARARRTACRSRAGPGSARSSARYASAGTHARATAG